MKDVDGKTLKAFVTPTARKSAIIVTDERRPYCTACERHADRERLNDSMGESVNREGFTTNRRSWQEAAGGSWASRRRRGRSCPKKLATGRNDSVIIPTYLLLLPPVSPLDAPPSSGTGGIFTR